jgi:hypothetical protein
VLNFGTSSYGLDQTLLKFTRKVHSWNPSVTVLGLLSGAAPRSTNIYLFLRPEQQMPFSKPRFVVQQDRLVPINVPNISPEEIQSSDSIFDLPLLNEDSFVVQPHWEKRLGDSSYVLRFLYSRFPRWLPNDERFSEQATITLAARLIEDVAAHARTSGSSLLIALLPTEADVNGRPPPYGEGVVSALAAKGLIVLNPLACMLSEVSREEMFVESGRHYSEKGNAALAKCIAPPIGALLDSSGAP